MKYLALLITLTLLSSCAALENYEYGDITDRVIELKEDYCADDNAESRTLILLAIRLLDPGYDGVCDNE